MNILINKGRVNNMYEVLNTIQNILNIIVWSNIFYTFYANIKGWNYGEKYRRHLSAGCVVALINLTVLAIKCSIK